MNGPATVVLLLTLVIALLASASTGSDPGIINVYGGNVTESVEWHQESVPVDRLLAIVDGPDGLERIGAERAPLREALNQVDVDFETQTLLVAYMGAVPKDAGHSIRVAGVQVLTDRQGQPARVVIRLAVAGPASDEAAAAEFEYPVALVPIGRSAWPAGVLEAVLRNELAVEATDQYGRDWGPVLVYGDEQR